MVVMASVEVHELKQLNEVLATHTRRLAQLAHNAAEKSEAAGAAIENEGRI
jgi:hypothetical protein